MITNTLADILDAIRPNLPPALISSEYLAQIRAVAQHLPGAMSTFFGFESRLSHETPQVDFLLYLTPHEGGRDILAGTVPAAALLEPLQGHPVWRQLRRFSQTWTDPASLLAGRVRDLWLEFDITAQPANLPAPSCFFCPQFSANDSGEWMADLAIPLLQGSPLPASIGQKILACLAELPAGAYIFQVGVMLSRSTEAVRLCVRNIAPAEVTPYLSRLGWPGPLAPLAGLIANLSRQVDRIDLNLDVGSTLWPKIGLECYFDHLRQPAVEPRWPLFLDFLVRCGLCGPAKRAALLRYPGYSRHQDQALWSDHLQVAASLLNNHCETVLFRGLHHIKIVYQPGYPLEAKAYLYVSRSLLSQDLLKQLSTTPVAA